ncbi:MFS transporter [Dasania marina]|uniref:MFS transporter n=1 Tax=Dasania marina TaxID=471499 RepID=UPI0003754AA3|nr:tetracycline resistance MFS efflux pump [Dasania marina]
MPILFITVVIDLIGFGIVIPILPFIGLEIGLSSFDIGVLIAIYSICSGICGPFWGKLSDKWGRKPIMLFCLFGGAVGYGLLAQADSYWSIFFARALGGVMAGNFGIASAIVADITTNENRAKGMGAIGAAFGIGMTVGPFLGGVLAGDHYNLALPSMVAAGLSLSAMLAGFLFLKESLGPEQRLLKAQQPADKSSLYGMMKQTGNRWLCLQYFLHNHSVSLMGYLFPLWVAAMLGWGPKETGYVFGAQGVVAVLIQGGLMGRLVKHVGELKLLAIGITGLITGYSIALFFQSEVGIVTAFFVAITGATFCMPVLNSLLSQRTPEAIRGRMMGTATSISALGRMSAPIAGGIMLTLFGYSAAWILGIVMGCIYLSWVVHELRQAKRQAIITEHG